MVWFILLQFRFSLKHASNSFMTVSQITITYHSTNIFIVTWIANSTDYETVEALIEKSSSNLPQSSLLEIARNPDFKSSINKLVIGKPVTKSDCSAGGYMAPKLLAESVQDAISKSAKDPTQWKAGIMGWQVWFFCWTCDKTLTFLISIIMPQVFMTLSILLPRISKPEYSGWWWIGRNKYKVGHVCWYMHSIVFVLASIFEIWSC